MSDLIEDQDGAPICEPEKIGRLIGFLAKEGGHLTIVYSELDERENKPNRWLIGIEFGREAEDSPMVAGASYHVGPDLPGCIDRVIEELKL